MSLTRGRHREYKDKDSQTDLQDVQAELFQHGRVLQVGPNNNNVNITLHKDFLAAAKQGGILKLETFIAVETEGRRILTLEWEDRKEAAEAIKSSVKLTFNQLMEEIYGKFIWILNTPDKLEPFEKLIISIKEKYNARLAEIFSGSLIFIFMHEDRESASKMVRDETGVEEIFRTFVAKCLNTSGELQIEVFQDDESVGRDRYGGQPLHDQAEKLYIELPGSTSEKDSDDLKIRLPTYKEDRDRYAGQPLYDQGETLQTKVPRLTGEKDSDDGKFSLSTYEKESKSEEDWTESSKEKLTPRSDDSMDTLLCIDVSGSIGEEGLKKVKGIAKEIVDALTMETQDDKGVEEGARMDSVTNAQGDGQISVGQAGAVAGPSQNDLNVVPDEINQVPGLANILQLSLEAVPSDSQHRNNVNIVQNAHFNFNNSSNTEVDQMPEWQYRLDDAKNIFVKTMGYENACDALEDLGHVLIIGSPGSGKTTISLCIMDKYLKKRYKVKFYEGASKFRPKDVSYQYATLLVFDDIFGKFSPTEIVNCMTVFEYMKTRFKHLEKMRGRRREDDEGAVPFKVIMNCRTNIYERVKRNFLEYQNSLLRGSAIADLTSLTKLSEQEKQKILKKHLDLRIFAQLSSEEIRTIAGLDYSSLGFPHICELFVDSKCPKNKIFEFFKMPMMYLVDMIENIFRQSEERACVLLLMVLNDGVLRLLDLQDPDEREACGLDSKLLLCREIIRNVPIPTDISEAAKQEKNSLLTSVHDAMKFSHPTIHDAVAFVVGNKNPLFMLEHCSLQFITERTEIDEHTQSPSGGDCTNFKILLSADAGRFLLKRLAKEIVGGNFELPLSHQCLKSEQHVDNLFEQLSKEDQTHFYLHSIDNRYGQGFLFWSSFICMGPVTKCSLKFTTFNCHEVLEGCYGCCMSGNAHSFQALTTNSSFHKAIVSSTLASILEGQSETRSEEKETVRMHGDNRDMLIHIAAANGFDSVVQILLELGCPIDAVGGNEMTALMYTCFLGHFELVKILVSMGADPLLLDEKGDNCLHLACRGGSIEIVRYLLAQNMDINERGEHDRTPLMMAFQHGQSNMIEFLLQEGSNFDPIDYENAQCIHFAAKSGVSSLVDLCLERGQDIEAVTITGLTPVKAGCLHGHLDLVKYLVQKGASVQEDTREWCLHNAVLGDHVQEDTREGCLHNAVLGGHLHVVEYIFDEFPDLYINKPNFQALTPLMLACRYASIDIFTFLLKKGVDVTCHDKFNLSCLHNACRGGSLEIVKTLINLGTFDIEEKDDNGMTPLGHAVKCNKFEVMEYLIQEGADINAGDQIIKTPVMFAIFNRNASFVDFLLSNGCKLSTVRQRGARITLLHFACYVNGMGTEIPEMLIQYGIHVDAPDSNNKTPVMCAVSNNNIVLVKFLLSKGCSLNTYNQKGIQNTLLHYACGSYNVGTEIIDELVSRGIGVNSRNSYHQTPVMCAARKGNRDVVEYLRCHGADLWFSDNKGRNCMCHAEEAGQTQMFEYLRRIMY